jgi:DNA-binding transcriptional ArsR family regulator
MLKPAGEGDEGCCGRESKGGEAADKKTPDQWPEDVSPYGQSDAIGALNHAIRRRILRLLHEPNGPRTPSRIAEKLEESLVDVSYHFKVLEAKRVISLVDLVQVRGAVAHVYRSEAANDSLVNKLLDETSEVDEGL